MSALIANERRECPSWHILQYRNTACQTFYTECYFDENI